MGLFKRKKKIQLDTQAQIDIAKDKVNEAFIMFQQAHDTVDEANDKLAITIDESNLKIASLTSQLENEQSVKQKAIDQYETNQVLKQQLKPFLA